jgi:hypothetical protein
MHLVPRQQAHCPLAPYITFVRLLAMGHLIRTG